MFPKSNMVYELRWLYQGDGSSPAQWTNSAGPSGGCLPFSTSAKRLHAIRKRMIREDGYSEGELRVYGPTARGMRDGDA